MFKLVRVAHPRICKNGSFRDGRSCDFFRFAIFLFCTGDSVDSYVVASSRCYNLSKAQGGNRGSPKKKIVCLVAVSRREKSENVF